MSTTQSRNRKILRYILGKLEKQMSGTSIDTEASTLTLEHILPTHPGVGWDAFRDDEIESFAQRLGNLALLEKGPNKDVGNAAFAEKRNAYATSNVPMTRRIAEQNDEWTPERIAARQNGMANAATGIWRVAQLA